MISRYSVAAAVVVLVAVLCCWPRPATSRAGGAPAGPPVYRLQGSASCSAMNCHNGNGPQGGWGSEYTTWISHDPHAKAYEVLFNETSRTIIKNMRMTAPAHKNLTCLKCHVHPQYDSVPRHRRFAKEDGVGCETCHGPAEQWLTRHYKVGWRSLSVEEKARFGMNDTKTVLGRVKTCTQCHVGSKGLDVNHDLIASGHPRLHFEFSAYHAVLPHHWNRAKDRARRPDFEAAGWMIGQLASSQAALELLAERVHPAKKHPWPEFAEYNCFACHHQLRGKSWRGGDFGKRRPGSLRWGTWYASLVPDVLRLHRTDAKPLERTFNELRKEMERPFPDRAKVRSLSLKSAATCKSLIDAVAKDRYTAADLQRMFRLATRNGLSRAEKSWDEAAQSYLALAALHHSWKDQRPTGPPAKLRPLLFDLRRMLRFPENQNSPGEAFSPALLRQRFEEIGRLVGP